MAAICLVASIAGCSSEQADAPSTPQQPSLTSSSPASAGSNAVGCGSNAVTAAVAFVRAVQAADQPAIDGCLSDDATLTDDAIASLMSTTLRLDEAAIGPFGNAQTDEVAVHILEPDVPRDGMPPHQSGVIVVTKADDGDKYVLTEVASFTST